MEGVKIFSTEVVNFLHKPIAYGVAHLLYGVALSDSVTMHLEREN